VRASSQVINYWLRYPAVLGSSKYEDLCWVKLMLYYPFEHFDKLLSIDGVAYLSYKDIFSDHCQHYSYLEDYYDDLELDIDDLPNNDDDPDDVEVGPNPKIEAPLADFEAYAQCQLDHD
jgi:hypothetical protein